MDLLAPENPALAKYEAAAQLKGILAQAVLPMEELTRPGAADSYKAMQRLLAAGPSVVGLIRGCLLPSAVRPEQIINLIRALDDETYARREIAVRELEQLVDQAVPPLRHALAGTMSLEARIRASRILSRIVPPNPMMLRLLRAIEILERDGSAEAIALLRDLAKADWLPERARSAKSAIERLETPRP